MRFAIVTATTKTAASDVKPAENATRAVAERPCECGTDHGLEWWDGYDPGRSDGFEEGIEWADEND